MALKKKKGKKLKKGKKSESDAILIKVADVPPCIEPCRGSDALLLQAIADKDTFLIARIFSESPGLDVNRRNREGWIPLHLAVHRGHLDVVELLITYGADVELRGCSAMACPTALIVAARGKHLEMCQLLVREGSRLNSVDANGFTALHHAVVGADEAIVQFLIDAGAPLGLSDSEGRTPSYWANRLAFPNIASKLPENTAYDVWAQYEAKPWFAAAAKTLSTLKISKVKKKKGKKSK